MTSKPRLSLLAAGALAAALGTPLGAGSALAGPGPQTTALVQPAPPAAQSPLRDEEFHYRWELGNVLGNVAGLFLPRRGQGSLTFKGQDGHLRSELLITSPGHDGEYWRYGAVIDPRRLQPIRAWSSYLWRGKTKSKSEEFPQQGVMDVVSGIYALRRNPPEKVRQMEIWSDGRVYPVQVIPLGLEQRKLPGGTVRARHFSIRGIDRPGARRWKGKLDIWLTPDASATPVEMLISRNLADVHLQLLPDEAAASRGSAPRGAARPL
jgi:Protein of unknown function (DUF3108)